MYRDKSHRYDSVIERETVENKVLNE